MSSWYFEQNGSQQGPISLEELQAHMETGQLQPSSLVWTETMANWAPLSEALPELAAKARIESISSALGHDGATGSANPYESPQSQPAPSTAYAPNPVEKNASTAMGLGIGSIVLGLCCPLGGIIMAIVAIVMSGNVNKAIAADPAIATDPAIAADPSLAKAISNAKTGKTCGIVGVVVSVGNIILSLVLNLGTIMAGV